MTQFELTKKANELRECAERYRFFSTCVHDEKTITEFEEASRAYDREAAALEREAFLSETYIPGQDDAA